jgi:lysine 2,3-aminomutase
MPALAAVTESEFLDYGWQRAHSVRTPEELGRALDGAVDADFLDEVTGARTDAGMALRLTPYTLSLVDWRSPEDDPIRRQFLPLRAELRPAHPLAVLDSLSEERDSPVPGLVHRYRNRALLLAVDSCPLYCAFCTRSYSVGPATAQVPEKRHHRPNPDRWAGALAYLEDHPEIDDVIISGGDAYNVSAAQLTSLGLRILDRPGTTQLRLATRGLTAAPMRIAPGDPWTEALVELAREAVRRRKRLALHVHFNSSRELTWVTERALDLLADRAPRLAVRNQSVILAGVNASVEEQAELYSCLGALSVQPYYAFLHDLVPQSEHLRTSLSVATDLEKALRGTVSGSSMPAFVVDLPGGGGKRSIHSAEHYDRRTGVSVWQSPAVAPGRLFVHADPLPSLEPGIAASWSDPEVARRYVEGASRWVQQRLEAESTIRRSNSS